MFFYQSPNKHINEKQGCPECAKITRWGTRGRYTYSQFVVEASSIHNNQTIKQRDKYLPSRHLKGFTECLRF